MTGQRWLGGLVVAVVGAAVAAGLVILGSPSDARLRRLDERRVAELRQLARDIDVFWTRRAALPASLDALAGEAGLGERRADPDTGEPYAYRAIDATHYELCAVFAAEAGAPGLAPDLAFWAHGAGRHCFTIEAQAAPRDPRIRN
jgi:hypothetical protein